VEWYESFFVFVIDPFVQFVFYDLLNLQIVLMFREDMVLDLRIDSYSSNQSIDVNSISILVSYRIRTTQNY